MPDSKASRYRKAVSGQGDPKKGGTTPPPPLMVEKADGTIGRWGNDIVGGATQSTNTPGMFRMYPQGSITQQDVDYLRTLNDAKVNEILTAPSVVQPGQVPQFGQDQSDVIKRLLAMRGGTAPVPPPIDPTALPLAAVAPPPIRIRATKK